VCAKNPEEFLKAIENVPVDALLCVDPEAPDLKYLLMKALDTTKASQVIPIGENCKRVEELLKSHNLSIYLELKHRHAIFLGD